MASDELLFNTEEMMAMREQYEERARQAEDRARRAEDRCEDLEWRVRLELARIRNAELDSRRAADEMRRVQQSLGELVAAVDELDVTDVVVEPTMPSVIVKAVIPPPRPPLTLPSLTGGKPSHANAFRAAMTTRGLA